MKTFTPSATVELDIAIYKLLNLTTCFTMGSKFFLLSYERHDQVESNGTSAAELDKIQVGLSDTLRDFANETLPDTHLKIRATAAQIVGSHVELNSADTADLPFSHLCNIKSIKPHATAELFEVEGLFYTPCGKNAHGVPEVDVSTDSKRLVPSVVIDRVWPGSSKAISVMASLGYSDDEVLTSLYTGSFLNLSTIKVELPSSDLS